MKVLAIILILVISGASAVLAKSDSIAERKAIMKQQSDQTRLAVRMVRGQEPFDPNKAAAVFQTYIDTTERFGTLFPENSKTGNTRAAPEIWTDRAGFNAALAEFTRDVKQNQDKIKTLEGFKMALSAVTDSCGSCHETYRTRR